MEFTPLSLTLHFNLKVFLNYSSLNFIKDHLQLNEWFAAFVVIDYNFSCSHPRQESGCSHWNFTNKPVLNIDKIIENDWYTENKQSCNCHIIWTTIVQLYTCVWGKDVFFFIPPFWWSTHYIHEAIVAFIKLKKLV